MVNAAPLLTPPAYRLTQVACSSREPDRLMQSVIKGLRERKTAAPCCLVHIPAKLVKYSSEIAETEKMIVNHHLFIYYVALNWFPVAATVTFPPIT